VEFDAFGPWILQVQSQEDVPRLYRKHPLDLDTARLVLKVPRVISRRDANSDMDLYDHLVVAGATSLTVLSRRGDTYQSAEVPYARIAAVSTSVALLDGLLVAHDVEGAAAAGVAVTFRYNGVSDDLVKQLVDILRAQAGAAAPPSWAGATAQAPHATPGTRDLGDADIALVTEQHELAEHDGLVTLGMHMRTVVRRRSGSMRGVLDMLRPVTLHAAIVSVGSGELHLVHRRRWFTTGKKPVHSVAHTVVILPHVTSVTADEMLRYAEVRAVQITSGRSVVEVPFPEGAESGAAIQRAVAALAAG